MRLMFGLEFKSATFCKRECFELQLPFCSEITKLKSFRLALRPYGKV